MDSSGQLPFSVHGSLPAKADEGNSNPVLSSDIALYRGFLFLNLINGLDMPTQKEIAEHLDMSERNARSVLQSLGIDWTTATMDGIRVAYIRDMREKAAGRGGEEHASLTKARTREAMASAELKELQIMEKAGKLVPLDEIEPRLLAMVTAVRQELLALPQKLAEDLRALHGLDVDCAMIEQHIYAALDHLANDLDADDCAPGSLPGA